jgi:hypothetical protein
LIPNSLLLVQPLPPLLTLNKVGLSLHRRGQPLHQKERTMEKETAQQSGPLGDYANKTKQGESTITLHDSSTGQIAYLSIPSVWSDEIKDQILHYVRGDLPDLRIESFRTAFTLFELVDESRPWPELFEKFIEGASTLIVACDGTRIVGPGILREIQMSSRGEKWIILFDVTEGRCRRFFGYDYIKGGMIKLRRGLRTKAEREALERRKKKRLRKREKYQMRLAIRMEGREMTV